MYTESVTVASADGFHARPAALLARAARACEAEVTIRRGDAEASATSIVALLALGVSQGDTVDVCADGDDEEATARRLAALIRSDFAET